MDIDGLLQKVEEKYKSNPYSTIDGLKIEIGKQWIHLRKSNTEPVIRIYAEAPSMVEADKLASQVMLDLTSFTKT
jgi:phosphomannomutase